MKIKSYFLLCTLLAISPIPVCAMEYDRETLINEYKGLVLGDTETFKKWANELNETPSGKLEIQEIYKKVESWACIGEDCFKNRAYLESLASPSSSGKADH